MEKYKRITDKRLQIGRFYEPKSKEERSELIDLSKQLSYENVYTRLAELETKIENGTLVELGYHIRKSYRNHDDQRYKIILIDEVEIDKIGYDGLTQVDAEKKLRELQDETK